MGKKKLANNQDPETKIKVWQPCKPGIICKDNSANTKKRITTKKFISFQH